MPFVQIHVPATFTTAQKESVSLSVHQSLVDVFNIPADDYFQVINALGERHLIHSDSYLGINYSGQLIYIYITCGIGRTVEMKQALYAAIAEKVSETAQISINDVFIMLNEIPWENWSFGQGKAQMLPKIAG